MYIIILVYYITWFLFHADLHVPSQLVNYDLNDFGTFSEEISYWLNHGFIPYMGGDHNIEMEITPNVDVVVNSHRRLLIGVCELHRILPLNHCCYYGKLWDGKFTYHKAGKSSQIDYIFTNQQGHKYITDAK